MCDICDGRTGKPAACPECGCLMCFDWTGFGDDVARPATVTDSGDVLCVRCAEQYEQEERMLTDELCSDYDDPMDMYDDSRKEKAMETAIGREATELTHQAEFPDKAACECGAHALIACAVREEDAEYDYVSELYPSLQGKGFWPHDAIAVAIYFCPACKACITKWNQA